MINILDKKRAAYRKKAAKTRDCQLCLPKTIREQSVKKLEGRLWRIIVNKFPYMDGNIMIVPKRHIKETGELTNEEWQELQEMINKSIKGLSKIIMFTDYNIGLNIGRLAGASIEHLHFQIIPRSAKILNSANVFGQIQVITIAPEELKKKLDGSQ